MPSKWHHPYPMVQGYVFSLHHVIDRAVRSTSAGTNNEHPSFSGAIVGKCRVEIPNTEIGQNSKHNYKLRYHASTSKEVIT